MKTLYEINWHYKDDEQTKFSHCTVTPIAKVSGAGTASAGLPGYAGDNNGD